MRGQFRRQRRALEAGIHTTLPPGAYTVIVEGVDGGTGVAVIGVCKVGS